MKKEKTKQGYSAEYTYDANGNRLTRTVNSVTETYEYDDADKLLNVKINNSPVKEYTYDDCGRLIAVESSAGVTSLSWDYEDRLIGITYPNQSTNSFGYNPFGARVSKTDSTGTRTYFRAGTSVVAPVLDDGSATYTPGISERRSDSSTFYHSDLKNTVAQTASNETVSGTNVYDAFGNLVNYTGDWHGPFSYGGAFGYQTDDDSGLMLLGHRYYDPSTGRFLSRDPIGDGSNWYVYCGNSPIKSFDFQGLIIRPANPNDFNSYAYYEDDEDLGLKAANQAKKRIGKGPNDCGQWVRAAYSGVCSVPPGSANTWAAWFKERPDDWEQIANDPKQFKPGDIIVITRKKKHGHIMIVGLPDKDGNLELYDASIATANRDSRPGTNKGAIKDPIKDSGGGEVSVWRKKKKKKEDEFKRQTPIPI